MNKKEKDIIVFTLLTIISLAIFIVIILYAAGVIKHSNENEWIPLIFAYAGGPVASLCITIGPKVLHFRKTQKVKEEIEEKVKQIEKLQKEINDLMHPKKVEPPKRTKIKGP